MQETLFSDTDRIVLTPSKMSKNDIVRDYQASPENIRVIYHGVDTERFNRTKLRRERASRRRLLGYGPENFVCLFTGGSWKRRGLEHALRALARIPDPSVQLAVVGRTKSRKTRKLARKLGIRNRVRLFGYAEKIEDFYVASDVLVFPSKYDSAGLVVLEALACGLPVITTETTGMHEVIDPGTSGFVVPRAEHEAQIAENINRLRRADSPANFREAAYATGQRHSFDSHFQAFESLLESQLASASE